MGSDGYDEKTRTTTRGKVVYRRKTHPFTAGAIDRIITKYNNDIHIYEARSQDTAIKIRSIFKVSQSLYAHVDDMFERPPELSKQQYEEIKRIWREGTYEIIDYIADYIAIRSGFAPLGTILRTIGKLYYTGMEYIFID